MIRQYMRFAQNPKINSLKQTNQQLNKFEN